MLVYLIRHAHAVPEGPALADEHRYLTEKGRAVAHKVGKKLLEKSVELDALLTSPLVRAVQTAELLAASLGFDGEVQAVGPLSPGVAPQVIAERLGGFGRSIAIVGHEPTISMLGALLVSRPSFPPFRPGQVSLVDNGLPAWTLPTDTMEFDQLMLA